MSDNNGKKHGTLHVIAGVEFPEDMPLIPPDLKSVLVKTDSGVITKFRPFNDGGFESLMQCYKRLLLNCDTRASFKVVCHCYIHGSLHRVIPNTCYIIDSSKGADVDINVTILQNDAGCDGSVQEGLCSRIHVRCARNDSKVMNMLSDVGNKIHSSGIKSICQKSGGDHGLCHWLGVTTCKRCSTHSDG